MLNEKQRKIIKKLSACYRCVQSKQHAVDIKMIKTIASGMIFAALLYWPTQATEDCPKRFKDYGLFLQAKNSCNHEGEYPRMKIMKACAKDTPQEVAVQLMDGGRREWANRVMRSSLGTMCDEVLSDVIALPAQRRR